VKRASLVLLGGIFVAGCSSSPAKEARPTSLTPMDGQPAEDQQRTIRNDPAWNRPPEAKNQPAPVEPERAVSLPDSVEVASAPTFPSPPRVAVAFVRGGKLVRRADALRRIEHELDAAARVEALERFADDAPSQLGLDELAARAEKQGAALLLVDRRESDEKDAERTTFVLLAQTPWKALAFMRPRTGEPAGQELVARLVRVSRNGP
jgi:hypothetical protein